MKFVIKYALEREEVVDASSFNVASDMAKEGKREGEIIVSVRTR